MLSAFSVKLWQFYGATALQFLKYTQWGLSQSLLSKCVSKDDTARPRDTRPQGVRTLEIHGS